jgi:hypothetical protein
VPNSREAPADVNGREFYTLSVSVLRRYVDPPTEVLDASAFAEDRPLKNVTPGPPRV